MGDEKRRDETRRVGEKKLQPSPVNIRCQIYIVVARIGRHTPYFAVTYNIHMLVCARTDFVHFVQFQLDSIRRYHSFPLYILVFDEMSPADLRALCVCVPVCSTCDSSRHRFGTHTQFSFVIRLVVGFFPFLSTVCIESNFVFGRFTSLFAGGFFPLRFFRFY